MLEDIRLAFQGIWSHKLRSALTMLGIIIGIGSIIEIMRSISSFIRETGHWICLIRRFRMEYRRFQIRYLVRSRHWMRWKVQPFITDGMNMMLYMQAVRSWQAVIFLE